MAVKVTRQTPEAAAERISGQRLAERFHIDVPLLAALLMLTAMGLLVLYSASGQRLDIVMRQALYFGLAYLIMLAAAQVSPRRYQRWAPGAYLFGLVLLVLVLLVGAGAKGAQRWLELFGLRFQPSELMKLLLPLAVAALLASRSLPPTFRTLLLSLLLIAAPTALVVRQPDLGTALLLAISGLSVLFVSGLGWRYIIGAACLAGASALPIWTHVLRDYQKQRILTLLNPEQDKLGAGWSIVQSKTAVGSGGWGGKGWLNGTQSQLDFLPESHTDFVAAVLAEEFGLRGVLALLAIYLLILLRGLWISLCAQDVFASLLGSALTLTFFVYIFVNMGMVSGLLPVVGLPLPLVSAGGTSLTTLLAGFGILMAISTDKRWF